ncbi:hypothetical protein OH77DRAFT_1392976 [Trametes cingulata]|nr:hypothetical protein OH77DRAFT_1392976 [Trametes cingulata]
MSQSAITLYDIRSTIPQPWAPHIWRIRFILNFKRLPHRTVWIEFAEVEATLHAIGAPASAVKSDGRCIYSLPVIVDNSGSKRSPIILSNANTIAEYLETAYPACPVFPEGSRAMQALFVHYIQEIFAKPLLPILIPLTHQQLSERSQAHFRGGGMTAAPPTALGSMQHEPAWLAVKQQFDFLASILDKNNSDGNGAVAMGCEVTNADFAVCSILIWIEKVSPHDCWARIREWNGGRWARLYSRCREYMDVC